MKKWLIAFVSLCAAFMSQLAHAVGSRHGREPANSCRSVDHQKQLKSWCSPAWTGRASDGLAFRRAKPFDRRVNRSGLAPALHIFTLRTHSNYLRLRSSYINCNGHFHVAHQV